MTNQPTQRRRNIILRERCQSGIEPIESSVDGDRIDVLPLRPGISRRGNQRGGPGVYSQSHQLAASLRMRRLQPSDRSQHIAPLQIAEGGQFSAALTVAAKIEYENVVAPL